MGYPRTRRLAFLFLLGALALPACDEDTPAGDDDSPEATPTPAPTPLETPTPTPTPEPTSTPVPGDTETSALRISGTTPTLGAMAVPRTTSFTVFFSEQISLSTAELSEVLKVTLTDGGGTATELTGPLLGSDGKSVVFGAIGLARDTRYTLSVELSEAMSQQPAPAAWPLTYEAGFTTEIPCGVSFDIAQQVDIVQLGANQSIVKVLNETLEQTGLMPVGMIFDDFFASGAFPASDLTVASGLVYSSKGEPYTLDDEYGLPVSMTGCSIDDAGRFTCGPQTFIFPIPINDATTINLYISNAMVEADMSSSGAVGTLANFRLSGVITEEDIQRIIEETDLTIINSLLVLDVDLDGDGEEDAATAVATSQPAWIELADCDASGG